MLLGYSRWSYPIVNHFRPDLLIVRNAMAAEYADTSKADATRTGRHAFVDAHLFHRYLEGGRIDDFRLIRSFDDVHLYGRRNGLAPRRGSWLALVEEYAEGKLRGARGARHRVAALLLADGDTTQAREQRTRGLRSEARAIRLYQDALKYLRAGRLEEAKDHFSEVVDLSVAESDSFQAHVRQRIARSFFEHSYFEEARSEAEYALKLNGNLRDLHFEHVMFLLASGHELAADSALATAIERFEAGGQGRSLLRQLVTQDIAADGAKRLLQKHFGGARER